MSSLTSDKLLFVLLSKRTYSLTVEY